MTTLYDVDIAKANEKISVALKNTGEIGEPEFTKFIKTGVHKERPPTQNDWWYKRLASVLTTVFRQGPIGVSKLRRKYGGRKNRGHKPEHFYKGSGAVVRRALQSLEKTGFIIQKEKAGHKGRIVTPKGQALVDKIAKEMQ